MHRRKVKIIMKIQDVLNAAKAFIVVQLNGDLNSIKFQSAILQNSSWKVGARFQEKGKPLLTFVVLEVSDTSGEIKTFVTK